MSMFDCPETFSAQFGAWYQFLLPRLILRVRLVITHTEFTKGRILAHIPVDPGKVAVIPSGVDSQFCPEAASQTEIAKASLKLPSSKYILAVGSVEPRKNLLRLLDAWARMQGRLPNDLWLLVVGGRGSRRVFGGVQLDTLPTRVLFLGYVAEEWLPGLYAGALATAYLSVYEGFGLPLLESMACGTPVLAGNRSSLPEVVGDAGLSVDPFNVDEIAQGLHRMVKDSALRAELQQRGLNRARRYSWDETAKLTWQALDASAAS
jgi:glycosyltransferase involved in cell wall biosynthesis